MILMDQALKDGADATFVELVHHCAGFSLADDEVSRSKVLFEESNTTELINELEDVKFDVNRSAVLAFGKVPQPLRVLPGGTLVDGSKEV